MFVPAKIRIKFKYLLFSEFIIIYLNRRHMLFGGKKSVFRRIFAQTYNNRLSFVSFLVFSGLWHDQCLRKLLFVELSVLSFEIYISKASDTWGPISEAKWSLEWVALSSRGCWSSSSCLSTGWWKFTLIALGVALLFGEWLENLRWWVFFLSAFLCLSNDGWHIGLSFVTLNRLLSDFHIFTCLTFPTLEKVLSLHLMLVWLKLSHGPLLERILIYRFVHFAIFFIWFI